MDRSIRQSWLPIRTESVAPSKRTFFAEHQIASHRTITLWFLAKLRVHCLNLSFAEKCHRGNGVLSTHFPSALRDICYPITEVLKKKTTPSVSFATSGPVPSTVLTLGALANSNCGSSSTPIFEKMITLMTNSMNSMIMMSIRILDPGQALFFTHPNVTTSTSFAFVFFRVLLCEVWQMSP